MGLVRGAAQEHRLDHRQSLRPPFRKAAVKTLARDPWLHGHQRVVTAVLIIDFWERLNMWRSHLDDGNMLRGSRFR